MIYQKLFRTGENWLENEGLFITALKPRGLIGITILRLCDGVAPLDLILPSVRKVN